MMTFVADQIREIFDSLERIKPGGLDRQMGAAGIQVLDATLGPLVHQDPPIAAARFELRQALGAYIGNGSVTTVAMRTPEHDQTFFDVVMTLLSTYAAVHDAARPTLAARDQGMDETPTANPIA
ncbi:hypothetical protein ACFZ8E_05065 [Methylobacterium sp. HMF5984]|uniref:hypothetical protein n=1 Tax=Methylobacterium sp. HMF5984 TaxID=3367370 RepID=UPI003855314C